MEKSKTIESVVATGSCTGCGTCAGICRRDAVSLAVDHPTGLYLPTVDIKKCSNCGLCLEACPGFGVDFGLLNRAIFGEQPQDMALGRYLGCYTGHAADRDLRYNSSSGGLVTALLVHALDEGMIQGALVTGMSREHPFEPRPFIARTRQEIVSSAGSKYCPVPANIALREILRSDDGRTFAVVGLPCQIQGIRKAAEADQKLKRRIMFVLGIFCSHSASFHQTEFALRKRNIRGEEVAQLLHRGPGWPGPMTVYLKDGTTAYVPYRELMLWHALGAFVPSGCTGCSDGTAELADLSLGDAWLREAAADKAGSSVVIARNDVGQKLIIGAAARGVIELKPTAPTLVSKSQAAQLYLKKKALAARMNLRRAQRPSPSNTAQSDALDYILALYEHLGISVLTRRWFGMRPLDWLPPAILRLYRMPLDVFCRIRLNAVVTKPPRMR